MKTKKKIICVSPKSNIAKDRFIHMMNSFHSCVIQNETENEYYVSSINNEYYFIVPKSENEHWTIHK